MQDVFRPSSGGIFFQPEDDSTPHVVTNTHVSTKPRRSIKGSVAIDGQAGQGQVSVEQAEAVNYALLVTTVFEARQLVDCAISVLASGSGSAVKIAIAAHHDPAGQASRRPDHRWKPERCKGWSQSSRSGPDLACRRYRPV